MNKKQLIYNLLKGIETGDPDSVAVVNEEKYIQHNPHTHEGSLGLAELFKQLAKTNPKVNLPRVFEDGDYVFAHTEYDFSNDNVGFEIFRFEQGQAVEHWDNIQKRLGPNPSGHSMVDGITDIDELENTEDNRAIIARFIDDVLLGGQVNKLDSYIHQAGYVEHNPYLTDDINTLAAALSESSSNPALNVRYDVCHCILAEGNFVLSVCEGYKNQIHTSFYDLYRLHNGQIIEHWDTIDAIADRSEWKNSNGKFNFA